MIPYIKVQEQAKLFYGDKNQNSGYFWKKRTGLMDMRVLF